MLFLEFLNRFSPPASIVEPDWDLLYVEISSNLMEGKFMPKVGQVVGPP
jgi:hypothetical protein